MQKREIDLTKEELQQAQEFANCIEQATRMNQRAKLLLGYVKSLAAQLEKLTKQHSELKGKYDALAGQGIDNANSSNS